MVGIEERVLLTTVDRILLERGGDPRVVTREDKIILAAQYVQLYSNQQHFLEGRSTQMALITTLDEDNRAVHPALRGRQVIGTPLNTHEGWIKLELIGPFYTDQKGNRAPVHVWVKESRLREATTEEYDMIYSAMVHCG